MFVIVQSGDLPTPYVPGRFRQRKVEPIWKIPKGEPVDHQSEKSRSPSASQPKTAHIQAYEAIKAMQEAGRSAILAADAMSSPVVSLPSGAKLEQAQAIVRAQRFRHIPITLDNGHVVGMLSDRDVLQGVADPAAYGIAPSMKPLQASVQQFMVQPVLVANPETEVRAIARVMFEEHIGSMPIVSENGQLLGMITRSDILRILISHPDFDQWV